LPPYCPHLNPLLGRLLRNRLSAMIERLWAVMHQHVTHNRYHPTQKQFANAILNFFRETSKMSGKPSEAKSQTISAS
jgi:transposase